MQLAPPSIVEHAKRRIAVLLDLGDRESRSDRVDRPRRHENDVVLKDGMPLDKVGDGAVVDRATQLLRRDPLLQSYGNLRAGICRKNVPGLGLAPRQSNGLRVGVVGMDLDGEVLLGDQQFEQELGTPTLILRHRY